MITQEKREAIVARLLAGEQQRSVARSFRISQQMVSRIWRQANGFRKGRKGGDFISRRYRQQLQRKIERKKKNG